MSHAVTMTLVAALLGVNVYGGNGEGDHVHVEFEMMLEDHEKISRMYELSLVARLEQLHKSRCMGVPPNQMFINQLEMEYREATGEQYQVHTCEYYLSLGG